MDTVIQLFRIALLKVGPTTSVNSQSITGQKAVMPAIGGATVGMPWRGDDDKVLVTKLQRLAIFQQDIGPIQGGALDRYKLRTS